MIDYFLFQTPGAKELREVSVLLLVPHCLRQRQRPGSNKVRVHHRLQNHCQPHHQRHLDQGGAGQPSQVEDMGRVQGKLESRTQVGKSKFIVVVVFFSIIHIVTIVSTDISYVIIILNDGRFEAVEGEGL